jgi:uncharacterized membrane protein YidH (DUF202 family)
MSQQPRDQFERRAIEWDDGVASERTVLAWERTAIASLTVAAVTVRAGAVAGLLGIAIPIAALLVLVGAVEWQFSRRIYAQHDRPLAQGAPLHGRAVATIAAVTLIAAAGSAVLAIWR